MSEAELILGPNTVVVVTPDNGGSVWFVSQIISLWCYLMMVDFIIDSSKNGGIDEVTC